MVTVCESLKSETVLNAGFEARILETKLTHNFVPSVFGMLNCRCQDSTEEKEKFHQPKTRHHGKFSSSIRLSEWKTVIQRYRVSLVGSLSSTVIVLFLLCLFGFAPSNYPKDRDLFNKTMGVVLKELAEFVLHPESAACRNPQEVSGNYDFSFLDGVKTVCLDTIDPNNCLIYSFGIGDDWSFDDEMHTAGCEVYSFDPSINRPAFRRNQHHWFHPWGLLTDTASTSGGWTLLSLADIKKLLGHENRHIDILKMDIEGAEWKFLQSASELFS